MLFDKFEIIRGEFNVKKKIPKMTLSYMIYELEKMNQISHNSFHVFNVFIVVDYLKIIILIKLN